MEKNEGGWNKEQGKFEKHGFPKVSERLTTQGGYSGVKCGTAGSANGQKDGARAGPACASLGRDPVAITHCDEGILTSAVRKARPAL